MNAFVEQRQDEIGLVLSCFGRLVITGALPDIRHLEATTAHLSYRDIHLKENHSRTLDSENSCFD